MYLKSRVNISEADLSRAVSRISQCGVLRFDIVHHQVKTHLLIHPAGVSPQHKVCAGTQLQRF